MNNSDILNLATQLLHANSEDEVINILTTAGFWNKRGCWRLLGDDENNFKTVGAQQARPEPALVEKLVNAVDARLTAACLLNGVDPASPAAPQTIEEARKRYFGTVERTELAKGITLAVTGARAQQDRMPCITICDIGEGQAPSAIPDTFMSIDRKNKLRIPFVQGKFNMGGTGALMFCGRQKLQLLITRRDPRILSQFGEPLKSDSHWSVTVLRRETPPEGPGHVRNPYFKYLAPVGENLNSERGNVLSFISDELDLMPEGNRPYARSMSWGTCIKLYEYDMRGFKGHILRTGGLLARLEVLLPEVALPMRAHECREGLRGHIGSYDTNLIGLRERLEASRGDSLEPGYPASLSLNIQGQPMTARIYAFKGENADRYRADQGVVFTINGQTHGWFPKSFFERKRVKMGRLAKSLLVVVDCTNISVDARADLFKNSRDRLSGGDLRRDIEDELEAQIGNHPGLRELKERRRREEVAEKLSEAKPLEDILRAIIKTSPSLSKLFLLGQRLSTPFKSSTLGKSGGGSSGTEQGVGEFKGKRHPTFFRFEKLKEGESLDRTCEHGRRCRLRLVTDVENEYFIRDADCGRYRVTVLEGALKGRDLTSSINLYNGAANCSIVIPEEDVEPGSALVLQLTIEDDLVPTPFINSAHIVITERSTRDDGDSGRPREYSGGKKTGGSSAGPDKGNSGQGSDGNPLGIELPRIYRVKRDGWEQRGFDQYSACTVIEESASDADDDRSIYEFYVNVHNVYLQTDIKDGSNSPTLVEEKFVYGNVLIALSLIHDRSRRKKKMGEGDSANGEDDNPISQYVDDVTRALGPFLVPMVEYLGALDSDEVSQLAQAGDEE